MAFTDAEKARIRRYLGFSQGFHDVDTRLEGQLDTLPSTWPEAETQVRDILTQLIAVDRKLQGAALGNMNFTEIVGEVKFLGPDQLDALREHGRTLIQQLAITFNIEMSGQPDYYGAVVSTGGIIQLG